MLLYYLLITRLLNCQHYCILYFYHVSYSDQKTSKISICLYSTFDDDDTSSDSFYWFHIDPPDYNTLLHALPAN